MELNDSKEWHSDSGHSSDAERDWSSYASRSPTRSRSPFSRLRDLRSWRIFHNGYQRLPFFVDASQTPIFHVKTPRWATTDRFRVPGRMSPTRLFTSVLLIVSLITLLAGLVHRVRNQSHTSPPEPPPPWMAYDRLDGYYNGIRTLVAPAEYVPGNRYNLTKPPPQITHTEDSQIPSSPSIEPVRFDPYPRYDSHEYLSQHEPVHQCHIDKEEKVSPPDIYAYPGIPADMPVPFYGSYRAIGLEENVCFDRYGRLGPYGYGYNQSHAGLGPGDHSENLGSEKIFDKTGFIDYSNADWADAQQRCYQKNEARFQENSTSGKTRVKRHAYVLRTWTGYHYGEHQILTMRAMISELSLKSGGEYDVHLLVHVKNNSIPIWADQATYRATLEANVPREFWNISTLWSEQQMATYYPEPFPFNFENRAGLPIHSVYRSAHFPLQWFSQQHPEYDFVWNWEMDLRYTGHYYEFNTKIGDWAKAQPRKGMWERSRRFYMPEHHGTWENFTQLVERETFEVDQATNNVTQNGPLPVWGPVQQDFEHGEMLPPPPGTTPPTSWDEDNYEWGVGEDADLLTFNPIFDPSKTGWIFTWDISGYNTSMPVPPRRTAIITVARLSRRLLNIMHEETWRLRHSMFPEMFPPSVAFHHGLKALYVPHPVYFDRDWDLEYMDQTFNHHKKPTDAVFSVGEHNMQGGSFYYNSGFSGALWRRWLGQSENGQGGYKEEQDGTGRMCLRSTLHHPVKHEHNSSD